MRSANTMRLCVVLLVAAVASASRHTRTARPVLPLTQNVELDQRAELMFRALDANGDQVITLEEAHASPQELQQHLPGITSQEFSAFLQLADSDQDGSVSRDELKKSLGDGMAQLNQPAQAAQSLVETDASAKRMGFLGGIGRFAKRVAGNALEGVKKFARGVTGKVDEREDVCVMCQYIVERCEANVRASGVIPGLTATAAQGGIFLETEAESQDKQMPGFALGAAATIGASRQATRYQRQMERQKFNEIYRLVDVTLDDVCEQGMPNRFYKYCKMAYQAQSEIVDGLRYQYRAADICFRVGMCSEKSYITKGVHSRY